MKTPLLALAIGGLCLSAGAFAEDKSKDDTKDVVVKELDAKGVPRMLERGTVDKPMILASAAELAKAIPVEEVQTRIKKEVDFAKVKVLFFAWSGSGGDKLTPTVEKSEKGPEILFQYKRGLTLDLRPHVHLFAIPKDATWKVQPAK